MNLYSIKVYNIQDIIEWRDNGVLQIDPDFQRRKVWKERAKSYLIDTILRGKPIPPIYIKQEIKSNQIKRVVIDGQQRLSTIFEFLNNDVKISKAHNTKLAGMYYSDLEEEDKINFLKYDIGVNQLVNIELGEVLDIFARLNSFSVTLNSQEKLNAEFNGYFKQSAYRIGFFLVSYLVEGGVLTKAQVSRMKEAELGSDLLIAFFSKIESNKVFKRYYKEYENNDINLASVEEKIIVTFNLLKNIYDTEELKTSNWKRIHLFYSLFIALGGLIDPINGLDNSLMKNKSFQAKDIGKVKAEIQKIDKDYDLASNGNQNLSSDLKQFYADSRNGTTDALVRERRTKYVHKRLTSVI